MESVSVRTAGSVALLAAAWLVIGNITHPIGSTEVYTDGVAFVGTTDTYWLVNHLLLGLSLLVTPWLVRLWTGGFKDPRARVLGHLAHPVAIIGTAIGIVHLAGIDGTALAAFRRLLDANPSEMTTAVVDGFQLLHLGTFTVWTMTFFGVLQVAMGAAMLLEGARPAWLGGLLMLCGVLGFGASFVSAGQGHLSTFSEGVLLRGSSVGLTIWLVWLAWVMRTRERVVLIESET